jgi:hypothetical protein
MTSVLAMAMGLLASCAVLAAPVPARPATRPHALPVEIAQFYGDVNFVAAFSDRLDRQRIRAAQRRRRLAALHLEPGLWSGDQAVISLSAREREVEVRLIRIEKRTLRIDDIAILGLGLREGSPAAELMRVVGQQWFGDMLRVRVEVWPITPEHSARLITDYEQRGRRDVSPVPAPVDRAGRPRLEAHRWRRVEGQWIRMEGIVVPAQKRPR